MANSNESNNEITTFLISANSSVAEALNWPNVSMRHVDEAITALMHVKALLVAEDRKAA